MFIRIDTKTKSPLYHQVYAFLRGEIEYGRIAGGTRLPSRRSLAENLRVSPGTIEQAYAQLVAEGYAYTKERSGYYASELQSLDLSGAPESQGDRVRASQKVTTEASPKKEKNPWLYDLKTNAVATERFPFSTWAGLMRDCLSKEKQSLLDPSDSRGDFDLRVEIARHLSLYRGVDATPDRIVVGAGSEFLLCLVVNLLGREKKYAVENPGYRKIERIFSSLGCRTRAIPVDANGIDITALRRSGADIVHVTPSHHFPLGTVMPVARRAALLSWAGESVGRYIIEDDYDSEFRLSGRPIPAIVSSDRSAGFLTNVIYMNTFTKTLAPSVRIGYILFPEELMDRFMRTLSFYACTVPSFEQRTLWRFLRNGHFIRHLNRMKTIYRARRDAFVETLEAETGGRVKLQGRETGLHLLALVENGMSEQNLVESALREGVKVTGLSAYSISESEEEKSGHGSPTIVLGYSGYDEGALKDAASRLARAWFGPAADE